ncbi:MAG: formylglycine-generating enzyme family protein [Chthoniobacteraceae bacterium]
MGFRRAFPLLLIAALAASPCLAADTPAGMVLIPAGSYTPLFRSEKDPKTIEVAAFYLDARPVTNGEFLEFVRAKPQWRRSAVKRLFADKGYLQHWAGDTELAPPASQSEKQPVVFVSWFAAKAYCAWKSKRLPSTVEWERAASAGFTVADGSKDTEFTSAIARWYSTPSSAVMPAAGSGQANFFGVRDLHGLIWEWTGDFNSAIVSGDARGDTDLDRGLFCGAGSLGAKDPANFPAFMRYGMRSSLKASYTIHNLGFRAAKDIEPK